MWSHWLVAFLADIGSFGTWGIQLGKTNLLAITKLGVEEVKVDFIPLTFLNPTKRHNH